MARAKAQENGRWTASQVVAHNLARARELRGLTQAEVAERLSRFTGSKWSQAAVAQAEGSVGGQRVRQFTANELVALARTFDLPVLFFFLPPDDRLGGLVTEDAKDGLEWEYLLVLLLGHRGNFAFLADRTANWSRLLANGIEIPPLDSPLDTDPILAQLAGAARHREPLLPEDVLAAVFHGLAARRMRGAKRPGDDVAAFVDNLRGLADALAAFNNYRPGTFVDETVVGEVAAKRRQGERRRRTVFEESSDEGDDNE